MSDVLERPGVGPMLREWRRRRRLSQLDLALDASVSARHLSFVETGRSRPSPEMVLRLAEELEVPLRERNRMLLAAGYAPAYPRTDLDDPSMGPVREAIERLLAAHDPYPAVVVDRHWGLVTANAAIALLTAEVAEDQLAPPINVLRLSLHPEGLAPRIVNLDQWRRHVLDRLLRQAEASADPALAALHAELGAYPGGTGPVPADPVAEAIAVPLRLRLPVGELSFLSTVTTFGTATDLTVAELAIEAFLPADARTADALRALAP